jgi:hypothetical protein
MKKDSKTVKESIEKETTAATDFEAYRDLHLRANGGTRKAPDDVNALEAKDVIAMIIAMLQLVLPIALAFMGTALLVMLLFRLFFGS